MIRYVKGVAPASLLEFAQTPGASWDGLIGKGPIREALVRDQRSVCAYCQRRIVVDGSMKIEHWIARSAPDGAAHELAWTNLLGVCSGITAITEASRHCDTHRGDLRPEHQALFLHPVVGRGADPRAYLRYSETGEAYSHPPEPRVDNDISALNLNAFVLKRERAATRRALVEHLRRMKFAPRKLRDRLAELEHGQMAKDYVEVERDYLIRKLRGQGESG